MSLTDAVMVAADTGDEDLARIVAAITADGPGETQGAGELFEAADEMPQQGRSRMPTADGYVHIDELPELLRAYGIVPSEQADRTAAQPAVGGDAARSLLGVFDDVQQRLWDTKKHPKWPKGHPQGGKFRPTASVALEGLTKFQAGDPFKDLDDAQLKKVAAGRDVDIPQGAGRDEIVKRLRDDLESKEGSPNRPEGVSAKSWETMRALASGERQTVTSDELPGLMDAIAKGKPGVFNLAKLDVRGEGNENLFRKHLSSEKRKTMPQLPTETGPDLDRFEDFLRSSGVKFAYGKTDPRRLSATQSELSGPKVAKLYGFMRDGGWKKGGVLIMSRDGAVIDGHHRWAGAAAASVARGGTLEVDTLVLDLDWKDALAAVKPFATFEDLAADRGGVSA